MQGKASPLDGWAPGPKKPHRGKYSELFPSLTVLPELGSETSQMVTKDSWRRRPGLERLARQIVSASGPREATARASGLLVPVLFSAVKKSGLAEHSRLTTISWDEFFGTGGLEGPRISTEHFPKDPLGKFSNTERNGPLLCVDNQLCPTPGALRKRSCSSGYGGVLNRNCISIPLSHSLAICIGSLAVGQKRVMIGFGWTSPTCTNIPPFSPPARCGHFIRKYNAVIYY